MHFKASLPVYIVACVSLLCLLSIRSLSLDDSLSYLYSAKSLAEDSLKDTDGGRAPVYPSYIVAVEKFGEFFALNGGFVTDKPFIDPAMTERLVNSQAALQLIFTLVLIAVVTSLFSGGTRAVVAVIATALFAYPPFVFHAKFIMTEALAIFFVCAGLSAYLLKKTKLTAVLFSLAVLTKQPLFFPTVVFIGAHLLWAKAGKRRAATAGLLLYIVPIFCWCGFNWAVNGSFTLTTFAGVGRASVIQNLWDKAAAGHPVAASIVLKYRHLDRERDPLPHMRAWPELMENFDRLPIVDERNVFGAPLQKHVRLSLYLGRITDQVVAENRGAALVVMLGEIRRLFEVDGDYFTERASELRTLGGEAFVAHPRLYSALLNLEWVMAPLVQGLIILGYALFFLLVLLVSLRKISPQKEEARMALVALACFICGQLFYVPFAFFESVRYTLPLFPFLFIGLAFTLPSLRTALYDSRHES